MTDHGKKREPDRLDGPIFVTGIWKSGNHLAYSALNEMGILGPFNGIGAHLIFGRYSWAKRILRGPKGHGDAVQVGLEMEAEVSRRFIAGEASKLSGKIMGGHAAYSPELAAILWQEDARMICIRRDPRDILVSFADWIGGRSDFYMHADFEPLSREGRVALLMHGGTISAGTLLPFPTVLARCEGWLSAPNVFQLSFEDLIGAPGGGCDELRTRAVAELHEYVGASKPLESVDVAAIYGGSLTFNKGRSQRWRELDSVDLVDEIAEVLRPHLATWGYAE